MRITRRIADCGLRIADFRRSSFASLRLGVLALILTAVLLCNACGGKGVNVNPGATFNSLSARTGRIATIYAPAALDALPLLAEEQRWSQTQRDKAKGWIGKIRDGSASISRTLGNIADSAISEGQKIIIGPLLIEIGNGLSDLDALGLFDSIEKSSGVELGIKLSAIALRTVGRLLPQYEVTAPVKSPQAAAAAFTTSDRKLQFVSDCIAGLYTECKLRGGRWYSKKGFGKAAVWTRDDGQVVTAPPPDPPGTCVRVSALNPVRTAVL